jgi:hypothetical protein
MNQKEFLPYQESLELKELGFKEKCAAHYIDEYDSELELKWKIYRNLSFNTDNCVQAPLYQQAFKFFRDTFDFRYSIGNTNISVVHYGTTQLLQNNATYEDAELATIRFFIEKAKQKNN